MISENQTAASQFGTGSQRRRPNLYVNGQGWMRGVRLWGCGVWWIQKLHIQIVLSRKMEKYKTVQILGEGSFGTVFLIEDQKGKKYALKKVQVDPFKTEESLLEIQVMSKFIHPNVVRVYESSQSENGQRIEILMEYCEGGDLLTYFKKKNKSLTLEEVLSVFRQIVKAFIAMNVKDVFHRDLKPENVLLKADGTIKIADFGCARMGNLDEISKVDNFSLDKGTPIYSSPEQLQNFPYSAKCDVWSAGCLLYFIYYGYHPFIQRTVQETLKKIKLLTEGKKIELSKDTHPEIKALLELTLVYEDHERASWRELWLSRFFCKKVDDVPGYICYLWSVCNMASWMVKEFWKAKKTLQISQDKNEIFAYFTIKLQYTFMLMATEICQKNPAYAYLFNELEYQSFRPEANKDIIKDTHEDVKPREKFFNSIREKLEGKHSYKKIKEKEPKRVSPFSDLDNSIKATYRLLKEVLPRLQNESDLMSSTGSSVNTSASSSDGHNMVWLMMAKWINFEFWFSFEKRPRIEEFLKDQPRNIMKEINREIDKYRYGVVQ